MGDKKLFLEYPEAEIPKIRVYGINDNLIEKLTFVHYKGIPCQRQLSDTFLCIRNK